MTTVTDAAPPSRGTIRTRLGASLLERLVTWVVRIRSTAGEGLEATVARAVDQAFASIAREYRR